MLIAGKQADCVLFVKRGRLTKPAGCYANRAHATCSSEDQGGQSMQRGLGWFMLAMLASKYTKWKSMHQMPHTWGRQVRLVGSLAEFIHERLHDAHGPARGLKQRMDKQ